MLVLPGHGEVPEDQRPDEHVVDREALLDQVARRSTPPPPGSPNTSSDEQPEREPDRDPARADSIAARRKLDDLGLAVQDEEVDEQQRAEEREERQPSPGRDVELAPRAASTSATNIGPTYPWAAGYPRSPRAPEEAQMAELDVTPARIDGGDVVGDRGQRGPFPLRRPRRRDRPEADRGRHRPRRGRRARHATAAARCPPYERAEILDRAAELLADRTRGVRRGRSREESAKPIATATVEAARAVDTMRFSAAVARTLTGEMIPLDASSAGVGKLGYVKRVPIGVVGAISPFNFPLNLVCHKIAPAVAAGCPVVLKPASATPAHGAADRRAVRGGRACRRAGSTWSPARVRSPTASSTHDDVAMITFTGSPEVGWGIRARVPRKRVVARARQQRAGDHRARRRLGAAAAKIAVAGLLVRRPVVHLGAAGLRARVDPRRVPRRAGRARSSSCGSATRPTTRPTSPALITHKETDRVKAWIDEARGRGRRVVVGRRRSATTACSARPSSTASRPR